MSTESQRPSRSKPPRIHSVSPGSDRDLELADQRLGRLGGEVERGEGVDVVEAELDRLVVRAMVAHGQGELAHVRDPGRDHVGVGVEREQAFGDPAIVEGRTRVGGLEADLDVVGAAQAGELGLGHDSALGPGVVGVGALGRAARRARHERTDERDDDGRGLDGVTHDLFVRGSISGIEGSTTPKLTKGLTPWPMLAPSSI